MSETAKWYVVHTYSGYENKVAQNIEKGVENQGFGDRIFEVRIPTEMVEEYTDDWDDYAMGWILGNYSALWLFGKVGVGLVNGYNDTDMVPFAKELSSDIRNIRKLFTDPNHADTTQGVLDVATAFGDALMSAGPPQTRALGVGLHAGSRLASRIKKLICNEQKEWQNHI